MVSAHWDESLAEEYRNLRYRFASKALANRTIIVAGGTGGLGAAVVSMLAMEGCRAIVGYRANRERAETLQRRAREEWGGESELIAGDISDPRVRREYALAAERSGESLAGAVIFSGIQRASRLNLWMMKR